MVVEAVDRKFVRPPHIEREVGDDPVVCDWQATVWLNTGWWNNTSYMKDGLFEPVEDCFGFMLFDHRSGREIDFFDRQPAHVLYCRKRNDPWFPPFIRLLDKREEDAIDGVLTIHTWHGPNDVRTARLERSRFFVQPASQTISLTTADNRAAQVAEDDGMLWLNLLSDRVYRGQIPYGLNPNTLIDSFVQSGTVPTGFRDIRSGVAF